MAEELREQLAREQLARELHDAVAGELQLMLVEMELLGRREDAPAELDGFRAEVRFALSSIRALLRELRDLPEDQGLVERAIDRKLARARKRHA